MIGCLTRYQPMKSSIALIEFMEWKSNETLPDRESRNRAWLDGIREQRNESRLESNWRIGHHACARRGHLAESATSLFASNDTRRRKRYMNTENLSFKDWIKEPFYGHLIVITDIATGNTRKRYYPSAFTVALLAIWLMMLGFVTGVKSCSTHHYQSHGWDISKLE